MLAQLTISNFAIVRELEIDFHSGMTAITGETGAGKSIAIDALGLCLGGRAEAESIVGGVIQRQHSQQQRYAHQHDAKPCQLPGHFPAGH